MKVKKYKKHTSKKYSQNIQPKNHSNFTLLIESFDLTGVIAVITDCEGKIINITGKAAELLCLPKNKITGICSFDKLLSDKLLKKWKETYAQILSGKSKSAQIFESEYVNKGDKKRAIAWKSTLLKDKTGITTAVISVGNDITDAKVQEKLFKKSEEKFKITFQTTSNAIAVIDEHGIVIEYNRATAELLGINQKEMLNKRFSKLMCRESLDDAYKKLQLVMQRGYSYGGEYKMIKKDKTIIDVVVSSTVVVDKNGKFTKAMVVIEDITNRKYLENILKDSEEKYRTVFNSLTDAVFVFQIQKNVKPIFIAVNQVACDRLGYTRAELLKLTPADINGTLDKKGVENIFSELMSKKTILFETIHKAKSGKLIYVEIKAKVFNLQGKNTVIAVARDIGDKKASERFEKEQNIYKELRTQIWQLASDRELSETELIKGLISKLGPALDCERVVYSAIDKDVLKVIYEWKLPSIKHSALGVKVEKKYFELFDLKKQMVLDIDLIVSKIPPPLKRAVHLFMKGFAVKFGYTPSIITPCFVSGNWEGVISCNAKSLFEEKEWSQEKKQFLTETAKIISRTIENRRNEKQAKENWMKYRTLFDGIKNPVFVIDLLWTRHILEVNDAACEKLGYTRDELIGINMNQFTLKKEEFFSEEIIAVLIKTGRIVFETFQKSKDGKVTPVEISASVIDYDGGKTVIAIVMDITHRLAAVQKAKTQNFYSALRMEIWRIAADRNNDEKTMINLLLEKIGSGLKVSRASYNIAAGKDIVGVNQWNGENVIPNIGHKSPVFLMGLMKKNTIYTFDSGGSFEFLPQTIRPIVSKILNEAMLRLKIRAVLVVPVFVDDKSEGVISLDVDYLNRDFSGFDEQGQTILLDLANIISQNLTKRKIENAIKESEELYRTLINISPDAIALSDLSGKLIFVSDRMLKLHGFTSVKDMVGCNIFDFVDTQSKAEMHTDFMDFLKTGNAINRQYIACRKNGSTFFGEINASISTNYDGTPKAVIAAIRDITERVKAVETIRESEEKYRTVINQTGRLIYEYNVSIGTIVWDGAVEEITGYTIKEYNSEVSIDIWTVMIHPEDRVRVLAALEKAEAECGKYNAEYRYLHKNGMYIEVEDTGIYLADDTGKAYKMVGVMKDITVRKKAEVKLKMIVDELTRSNAELEQFAYVASHDLQEPLRMVSSYVQLLKKRYSEKLGPDADDFIAYAVDGANRMQMLIKDLLTFSHVGTNKKEYVFINLEKPVKTAIINLEAIIKETNAVIEYINMPQVYADERQMIQIIQNIVSNSIKFTGAGIIPHVIINSSKNMDEYIISIKDNGIGIKQVYFEKIFVIFQRLNGKDEYPGTGIGLAICKKIVESYGGRIWLESKEGEGTTFFFSVPVKKPKGDSND